MYGVVFHIPKIKLQYENNSSSKNCKGIMEKLDQNSNLLKFILWVVKLNKMIVLPYEWNMSHVSVMLQNLTFMWITMVIL